MKTIQGKNLYKFWKIETPSGLVNGTNTVFVLSQDPVENDVVLVFLNGLVKKPGSEYSIEGKTITFSVAPALAQEITVQYVQNLGGE